MKYSFDEIHALNLLSDNAEYSKRFNIPRDLKIVTLLILLAVGIVLTVAILFKVDKIVPAKGVLETKAELFALRNNQQGYVDVIHVVEGDQVKVGDLLVNFDTKLLDLDIESLQQSLVSLSRALWRDFYQLDKVVSSETAIALTEQIRGVERPVMQAGWKKSLVAPIEKALQQNTQAQKDVSMQLQQQRQQLIVLHQALSMDEQQLKRLTNLFKKQIESRINVEQQQRQVLDAMNNVDKLSSSIDQLLFQQTRLQTDRQKLISDYELERLERFYTNLDQHQQTRIELAKQQRVRDEMVITAPINGTVDGVAIKGAGELMNGNSTLLTLRPIFNKNDLLIEIQIPSNYAVWVESGMAFRASALGNNPDDHGYINGVVDFVSESTAEAKEGAGRYYRMIGKITEFELSARGLEPAFLRPGLELSVEIKAGKRRLINYIFDPFTKHFRTAFSEPS